LEAIPGWTWSIKEDAFERAIQSLIDYSKETGHSRVSKGYVTETGFPLGTWVNNKRKDFRDGKLPLDQVEVLEGINGWSWNPRREDWELGLMHLKEYEAVHGNCRVAKGHKTASGFPLGSWVSKQKTKFGKGSLTSQDKEDLESIATWAWNNKETGWQTNFGLLVKFTQREGHSRVPSGHVEEGMQLGRWVVRQRQSHQDGSLPQSRALALESLKGWSWNTHDSLWEDGMHCLLAFVKRTGHSRVPSGHKEGQFNLDIWVNSRRHDYKLGKLESEKVNELNEVPGWVWDVLEWQWMESYDLLLKFAAREGHANVPQKHQEEGKKLGMWMSGQRQLYRKKKLSQERIELLEKVPGWSWNVE
jgi:hypothetical protein